jgi:heme/copper-type cytochrome/quinol oxidase subunit 3
MSTASIAPISGHAAEGGTAARPLGWYGMLFFIASEAVFFANLIASSLYLRFRADQWPPQYNIYHFEENKVLVAINTVILLSSSFPMHLAGRSAVRGNRRGLILGLLGTVILGTTFLSIQLYEYTHSNFGPQSGIFGSTFFTLTGFHGAHVTAGLLFLLVCLVRSIRGDFSATKHFAVQAAEMYWHFVDVVWIFVFTVLYLTVQLPPR